MDWGSYFERNRARRMLIPWERGIAVEPQLREPLIRSLQRYQVGEQGEGVHLKAGALATGDQDYAAAISMFVQEEQEHARLLAELLRGLGAPLLRRHWSDSCFICLRHLAGFHLELMVLLVAEMIAKRYYRALHEGTDDPVLKTAFAQILRDELGHIAFHCDYLQRRFAGQPALVRQAIRLSWRAVFRATCLVVMVDHRAVLRAVTVAPAAFWHDCGQIFDETANRIFASARRSEEPATAGQPK
jgi:hypothetical protein